MPVILPSAEAYAAMMMDLLPPSRLWRTDLGGVLKRIMLACGDELARVSARALALVDEANPLTAVELLPEWERLVAADSLGTVTERQKLVAALYVRRQGARPADFQVLAPLLGQDAEDVVVIERGRAFAVLVGDDRQIYAFYIFRDPALPGSYDVARAQALVDQMAPSHTKGKVIESRTFRCNNPHSRCNRDLLGH